MRITFPKSRTRIIRKNNSIGVNLAVRRVNQHEIYFVTDTGTTDYTARILAMGGRKHCVAMFNKMSLLGFDQIETFE